MCEFLGYEVLALKRLRIMNIHLGNLRKGEHRNFTPEEFRDLNKMLVGSEKTID